MRQSEFIDIEQAVGTTSFGNTCFGGIGFGTIDSSKLLIRTTTTTTTKKPAQEVNLLDLDFGPNTSSSNTSATDSINTSLNLLGDSFSSKPVQQ